MKSILVIEDNEADRFLGEVIIQNSGIVSKIHFAHDGQHALEVLQEIDPPDAILLDINMPKMNGHEFLEEYSLHNEREIPVVVMLTSSNQDQDKEKANAYKCVKDYMLKPISEEKLKALKDLVESLNK